MEKQLIEEDTKIKEELVSKCKQGLEQETINIEKEKKAKQDTEMQLSKALVDRAILGEDTDVLVDIINEFADKQKKKKLELKASVEKFRSDKLKETILEIINHSGIKNDISG